MAQGTGYVYTQRGDVVLGNRSGTTRNQPSSYKPFKLLKGVDTTITFFIRNINGCKVQLHEKNIKAQITKHDSHAVLVSKNLRITDYENGVATLHITPGDIANLDAAFYNILLTYTSSDNKITALHADQNYRYCYVAEVMDDCGPMEMMAQSVISDFAMGVDQTGTIPGVMSPDWTVEPQLAKFPITYPDQKGDCENCSGCNAEFDVTKGPGFGGDGEYNPELPRIANGNVGLRPGTGGVPEDSDGTGSGTPSTGTSYPMLDGTGPSNVGSDGILAGGGGDGGTGIPTGNSYNPNGAPGYRIYITNPGAGYNPGDTIVIPGSRFGGIDGVNNLRITITTVNARGGILTYNTSGIPNLNIYNITTNRLDGPAQTTANCGGINVFSIAYGNGFTGTFKMQATLNSNPTSDADWFDVPRVCGYSSVITANNGTGTEAYSTDGMFMYIRFKFTIYSGRVDKIHYRR